MLNMKKIFVLLFMCLAMISCNDRPRTLCVVIDKQCIAHKIFSDEYYLIVKNIYNEQKKIAPVGKDTYLLYNVGDTLPEPFSAHR